MQSKQYQKPLRKLITWVLSLLTPALISTGVATFFIWAHLARIDQTDIFFDSVSFSALFNYLMVFACASILFFCVVLFMPSLLTGLFIYHDPVTSEQRDALTEKNIQNILLTSMMSVLIFFGWFFLSYLSEKEKTPQVPVQLGLVWVCSIILSVYQHIRLTLNRVRGTGFWRTTGTVIFMHFLQPALFALAAIVWIFPIELFLRTMEFPDGTTEFRQSLTIIALSIFLVIFSLMPGVVFLRLRGRTGLLQQIGVTGGIMAGVLIVICLFVHAVPALILTMFLRTSGIIDLRPHVVAVPIAAYPVEYFREEAWQGKQSEDKRFYLLQAVKLYSLGNIRLICPKNVVKPWKKSLRYQVLDTEFDDNVRGELQEAVSHCRRVSAQELLTLERLPEK